MIPRRVVNNPTQTGSPTVRTSQFIKTNLHLPAAALLAIAGCLKAHQLMVVPVTEDMFFATRLENALLICFELGLTVWLLSGVYMKAAKWFTLVSFFAFILITGGMLLNGRTSCGCFGTFSVPPIVTLVADTVVFTCLIAWSPKLRYSRRFQSLTLSIGVVSICFLGMQVLIAKPLTATTENIANSVGQILVIEPETWQGQALPIEKQLSGDVEPILSGEWTVVLYHQGCPKCQEIIKSANGSTKSFAFIEVPPLHSPIHHDTSRIRWLHLSSDRDWFVSAPAVFQLKDGIVE